jgi:protein-disulfide isomerase
MWRSPIVLVSVGGLVLAAVAIGIALLGMPALGGPIVTPPTSYPPALVDGDNLGSGTAPVVMELYADFQCPACRTFVTKQLERLVSDFVLPGTLRIEARDIAFLGRGANDESLELAAGARCAAEQSRYWQFHDYVFWNQGRENRGDHNRAFIERMAGAAGLEPTAFAACLGRSDVRSAIRSQTNSAMGQGIQSTPTLIVNGARVVGVPAYADLADLIRRSAAAGVASAVIGG